MSKSKQLNGAPNGADDESAVAAVAAAAAGDTLATDQEDSFLDELAKLQAETEQETRFKTLDEIFLAEEAEQNGVWCKWPDLPDAEFLIGHTTLAIEYREKLETKYREKLALPAIDEKTGLPTRLTKKQHEAIYRESLFGTTLRGWRGKSLEGFAFTPENYRKLVTSRRFRVFLLNRSQSSETFRLKREKDLSGN